MAPGPLDFIVASVGLGLVLLGGLVLARSRDDQMAIAFWRVCLFTGVSMGLVPAGLHGWLPAIALEYVSLRLFGLVFLDLALVFPTGSVRPRYSVLLPLPTLAALLLYTASWWRPDPVFILAEGTGNSVLLGCMLGACARLVWLLRRPLDAQQRAQLSLLTLGLLGGFAPFILLTLLPLILAGRPLVPSALSILALVALPLCLARAIAQADFMGVTSIVHRRTLRTLLGAALLAALAASAALIMAAAQRRYGWPLAPVLAGTGAATALAFAPLRWWLIRQAERFFLRDAYDTGRTLLDVSVDLARATPGDVGPLVVARLGAVLDLSFAVLVAPDGAWTYVHPRSEPPVALRQAVADRAHALREGPAAADAEGVVVARVERLPVAFLPVREGGRALAVLCLGPKRSGDRYTAQDRAMLRAVAGHLAVVLHNHQLHAQLDAQIAALQESVDERALLTERLCATADGERRRLAGVLHDDAIQLAGELARAVRDALETPALQEEAARRLAPAARVGEELVTHLRSIATELQPPVAMMGLVPALDGVLREAEQRAAGRCACTLEVDPGLDPWIIPASAAVTLYNIAREAIGNAVAHGEARSVRVALRAEPGGLRLRVGDDGRGFAPPTLRKALAGGHLGMVLMRERAREMGGTLEMSTAPGRGTTIEVVAPLDWAALRAQADREDAQLEEECA